MGGNVSEWCRDAIENVKGFGASRRYRGGNWCFDPGFAVSSYQYDPIPAEAAANWVGFRPVCELGEKR